MTGRAAQKTETRRRILAAARRLCGERGFSGLRTAEVAGAAGLSHGAVFVHFPTRDDLLAAVASQVGSEITEALHTLVSRGASLRDVLRAHLLSLAAREDLYRWLILEEPLLPAGFRVEWTGLQSAIAHHICQAAERELRRGAIRRSPVHLLFNTWIGLVHHYLVQRELFAPGRSVLRVRGPELLDHFLGLFATSPPTRRRR